VGAALGDGVRGLAQQAIEAAVDVVVVGDAAGGATGEGEVDSQPAAIGRQQVEQAAHRGAHDDVDRVAGGLVRRDGDGEGVDAARRRRHR